MKGLELLLAKGSPKDESDAPEMDGEDAPEEDKEASMEDEFLSDAFDALQSGDKDGFLEALKSFKGC